MEVPLRLSRINSPTTTADAYLLPAEGYGRLVAILQQSGTDPLPTVHEVRGGFLLVFLEATTRKLPGTIRLRNTAGDLYTLADAELLPRLLPDEIVSLTRDRGLVVLPGGQVLAFDPSRPLSVEDWLAPSRVRRAVWEPFPPRPERADRLTVIERPASPAAAIEILSSGQPDAADPLPGAGETGTRGAVSEDTRPPASGSALDRLAAGVQLGAGRFIVWLARAARAPGLAERGAELARRAMEKVPRLSERVLGAQEAALREVLRQLQTGDVEKALKRAPIAVPDPSSATRIETGADLGSRDPRYSLRDLIGTCRGPGAAWLGGGDVWARLAEEYRRLAREAAARGDFRRAAYLHGILLRDLRSAANVLMAGGLFRDAAILFRDKLLDEPAAAAAFEKAGDYDEAVRLYDKLGQFEPAGDLLRRIGEEGRAEDLFTRAANALQKRGRYLAAGDLIRRKLGDEGKATGYYRRGWDVDGAESVTCGHRLLDQYLVTEAWADLDGLVAGAVPRYAPPRSREAGQFFNYLLDPGPDFLPRDRKDELADRIRLLFADHLRAQTGSPRMAENVAGDLYGNRTSWPAPVVRDAAYAARQAATPAEGRRVLDRSVRLADGTVRTVVVARDTGDVVIGTTSAVVCWRAGSGLILPVFSTGLRKVLGLSIDPPGRILYVLYEDDDEVRLRCFSSSGPGPFESMGQFTIPDAVGEQGELYLQPTAGAVDGEPVVTLATPSGRTSYRTVYLLPETPREFLTVSDSKTYLLARGPACNWDWQGRVVRCLEGAEPATSRHWLASWLPAVPPGSALVTAHTDWASPASRTLEVVGIDNEGTLYWSEFDDPASGAGQHRTVCLSHVDGIRAACLAGPAAVFVATGRNEVYRFRVVNMAFRQVAGPVIASVPTRITFLATRRHSKEVVVITEDGFAVTIPGL